MDMEVTTLQLPPWSLPKNYFRTLTESELGHYGVRTTGLISHISSLWDVACTITPSGVGRDRNFLSVLELRSSHPTAIIKKKQKKLKN